MRALVARALASDDRVSEYDIMCRSFLLAILDALDVGIRISNEEGSRLTDQTAAAHGGACERLHPCWCLSLGLGFDLNHLPYYAV